jgi:hypothetical protein
MEYDWFWVILAVGVFTTVAIVPLELALEAYWRWREPRRNQREREIAGRPPVSNRYHPQKFSEAAATA